MKVDNTTSEDPHETRLGSTQLAVFLAIFLPLLLLYGATARWSHPYHIDAATNALTGWYVANEGTFIAEQHEAVTAPDQQAHRPWLVESPSGPVSQYPPGAALWTSVFYLLDSGELSAVADGSGSDTSNPLRLPPLWPATLGAVVATAAAASVLGLVFYRISSDRRAAVVGGIAFGVATTAWTVASAMSWTHGPAMLAISLGLLAAASDRWWWCGIALGFAVLTRPHLALIAAAIGVGVTFRQRNLRPMLKVGVASSAGLALLIGFNYWIWRRVTISGGYGSHFADQFLNADLGCYLSNIWGGLFDMERGLLIWAPFVGFLGVAALADRKQAPAWANWAAVGGVLYLLVQYRANRFSGGSAFFAYRYPLEMLTAAAPVLYLAYLRLSAASPWARRGIAVATAVGVGGQLGYVLTHSQLGTLF